MKKTLSAILLLLPLAASFAQVEQQESGQSQLQTVEAELPSPSQEAQEQSPQYPEGEMEVQSQLDLASSPATVASSGADSFPEFVFQPPTPITLEEFLATRNNFRLFFDEGATVSWNTRIIKQTGRTNFVFKDFLVGLYFTTRTKNFSELLPFKLPVEVFARVSAYYPLSHTFNDYPQPPVNMLNFGVDFMMGPSFQISFWDWAFLNLGGGPHVLYQRADRWHYVHLGIGGMLDLEFPLARRWSLLLSGLASIDNANLGSNRHMEPYDLAWQYQVSFGVRYSRNTPNTKFYIPSKKTDAHDYEKYLQKEHRKSLRQQQRQWKKSEKEWLKTLSEDERNAYLEHSKQLKAQEKVRKKEEIDLEEAHRQE